MRKERESKDNAGKATGGRSDRKGGREEGKALVRAHPFQGETAKGTERVWVFREKERTEILLRDYERGRTRL